MLIALCSEGIFYTLPLREPKSFVVSWTSVGCFCASESSQEPRNTSLDEFYAKKLIMLHFIAKKFTDVEAFVEKQIVLFDSIRTIFREYLYERFILKQDLSLS